MEIKFQGGETTQKNDFYEKEHKEKKKNISENYQKQKQTEWYLWVKILELWHAIKVICLIVSNQREAWKYQKERNNDQADMKNKIQFLAVKNINIKIEIQLND